MFYGVPMSEKDVLKGKKVLVIDDEPDILETISEMLDDCEVHKAGDFDSGLQMLLDNHYDAVILDIMGVNGFELLKNSNARGFPTIMITAYAITPEALKKSIDMGAAAFLPKELMVEIKELLKEVFQGGGKRLWWLKSLKKTGPYFDRKFGSGWEEQHKVFKELTTKSCH
jgi:DNA-binding response OmpR family regulator